MELHIDRTIRRCRKALDITQEQLASGIGVSPQSVSKWECGDGYPDITLLPVIANYFKISVDELIGNDDAGREEDERLFEEKFRKLYGEPKNQIELCLDYRRRYPDEYKYCDRIGHIITRCGMREELPLLREVCESTVQNCTDQYYRQQAAKYMCMFAESGEIDRWLDHCAPSYDSYRGEMYEAWLFGQGRYDESREMWYINNLELFSHLFISRGRHYGKPEMSRENCLNFIRLCEWFGDEGIIPDGWLGLTVLTGLRLAAAEFACGNTESGFAALESALAGFERWHKIPNGTPLEIGKFFGGIKALKNKCAVITPSGKEKKYVDTQAMHFHTGQLIDILTHSDGWSWFDAVRTSDRFEAAVKYAEKICGEGK
nr:helix-turn-helix transcriptional regulator [Clostridia bacterium]